MARQEKAVFKNNAPRNNKPASELGKDQFYGIRGTSHVGQTKESLKAKRRELNHAVGVYEVPTEIEKTIFPAAPSNTWPYRITKTHAHPHNATT